MRKLLLKAWATIQYESIRPVALWTSAILFGLGVVMRLLPAWMNPMVYIGFLAWEGWGMIVWGTVAIVASLLMLGGLLLERRFVLFLGTLGGLSVFVRSALAFVDTGAFTTSYVNAVHALMMVWIIYRIQKDGQII